MTTTLPIVTCMLLIVPCAVYVFALPIDLISQLRTGELKTLLMFIFSFVGTLIFSISGAILLSVYPSTWYVIAMACLSFLLFVLFVVEISLILVYWRRTCSLCQQYCYSKKLEELYQKKFCDPLCTQTVKHDLMTSVSSIKVSSGDENAEPDHSKRKISYGHRRQYVDCPTSARNLCFLEVADVQTERNQTLSTQSQTHREVKEAPVQTVSRCELCNQQIQLSSGSTMQPTTQQTPCAPCPALIQLLRGTPCCPGCRCVRGIIQVSRQSQQQQTQRPEQAKQDKEASKEQTRLQPVDDMLTSNQHQQQDPTLAGVPGIVTKLTLASYCVTPKKIHTSCQTAVPKTIRKNGDPEESKRGRVGLSRKGKEDQKVETKNKNQVSISETKKVILPTSNDANEPAEKEVPGEPPAKMSQSPTEKPTESSPQEMPESLSEEAKSPSERSIDIHKALSEKKLIPPRRQVAEMIDRLQEIEGTKSESPLKQIDLDISGTNETKRGIPDDGTGDKRNDKKRKVKQARVMIADQHDEKMTPSDPINSVKVIRFNSESEMSTMSYRDSEISMEQKQTKDDGNETEKYTKDTKVSDKSKRDVKTMEQSQETDSTSQPQAETQTNLAEMIGPNNRLKRTYVFRKRNKVEPAELMHTDINVQTSDLTDTSASVPTTETETLFAEKPASPEERAIDICHACKKLQVPTTSSSFQYCYVHRDKRGRFYCEYCAPRNSVKVLYKKEADQKNLECYTCGNYLRTKSNQTKRNKTDNCPQCGQMQLPAQPTVSA